MYNGLVINKVLKVHETLGETVERLSALAKEDFHLEKVSDWRYVFLANESYGTFMNLGITGGIRIYVNLDFENENKTHIKLKSKPRLELLLYIFGWIGFIISQISGDTDFPIWINFINAIVLFVGWVFYRKQEISLLRISETKIINALKSI